jgi:hypothetical protein
VDALVLHIWELIMVSVLPLLALIEAGRRGLQAYRRWRRRDEGPLFRIL